MHAVTGTGQNLDGVAQDFRLEGRIEAVGPQHDFVTSFGTKAGAALIEPVAAPQRQIALGAEPHQDFGQPA